MPLVPSPRATALRRSHEANVGAACLVRSHEHRLFASVADTTRRWWHTMVCHPARRGVHAARTVQHLERPWTATGQGFGSRARLGGLCHRQASRPEIEHRHVCFDDCPALYLRSRHSEHVANFLPLGAGLPGPWLYVPAAVATSATAIYTRSTRSAPLGCMPACDACRRRSGSGVRCSIKKIGSGFCGPSVAAFQRNSWPVGV